MFYTDVVDISVLQVLTAKYLIIQITKIYIKVPTNEHSMKKSSLKSCVDYTCNGKQKDTTLPYITFTPMLKQGK